LTFQLIPMFRNYFKVALRNLWRNRGFSALNIVGLALGVTAFLLIMNYIRFEHSFDDFLAGKERIYRVPMTVREKDGKVQTFAFTYPAVAAALKSNFPEIQETVRFRKRYGVVRSGENKFLEGGTLYYVDPAIFKIFSFPFKSGNGETGLAQLNDAVITESAAKKYFGNADPVGQQLHYNDEDYTVRGVLKDLPANSHLHFNVLLNFQKYIQLVKKNGGDADGSWGWSDFYTYVLLKPGTNAKALEAKIPPMVDRYRGADMKERSYQLSLQLQPIKDIHLRSNYDYELEGNGNLSYLKYLAIAALFILFIAWINYVNLSTARALDRSKEVGVRKVIGANRFQLIRQFMTESVFINVLSIAIGIVLFSLLLIPFSSLVQQQVADLKMMGTQFWLMIGALFFVGTILAGFYPAFVMSSFKPIQTLKSSPGFSGKGTNNQFLRRSLVVIQFSAAIVLIAGAIGFYQQLRYMSNRDLGVDIQQTLVLNQTIGLDSSKIISVQSFIDDLKSNPDIKSVTASTSVPGGEVGGSEGFTLGTSLAEKRCRVFGIDDQFINAYGLKIVAGRAFDKDPKSTDANTRINVIVNETAAKIFGFGKSEEILGKELHAGKTTSTVIGVMKDYHQESLQFNYDPIVFYPGVENEFGNFSLKVHTSNMPQLLSFVKKTWTARFPESPFTYNFLDERYDAQYKNDRLFSTVLLLFTALAIVVACLGLFGLSLFTVAKRAKELSIRKVLGASIFQVVSLITKDYLKLVLLAGLVAIPAAWYLLRNWLNDYAFHIEIGWWFFLVPLVLIILIAGATVSYQSLKAALANPVKSLRNE